MSTNNYPIVDYGFTQALNQIFPNPIIAHRDPTTHDKGTPGQIWVNLTNGAGYLLTQVANNTYTWQPFGGSFTSLSSLTVTPGPINLTGALTTAGTTLINTTGTAATSLGNTGATTTISGTAINLNGTLALASGGPEIIFGTGDPVATVPQGTLYLKTDASTTTDRLWIAADSAGTWAFFTASA